MFHARTLSLNCFALMAITSSATLIAEESQRTYYAASADVVVYAIPSLEGAILRRLGLADSFGVDTAISAGEWLPYREAWRGQVDGWVSKRQLVSDEDFVRVSDCWPFQRVEVAVGDWFQYAELNQNGEGIAGDNEGEGPAKAFISGRVVKVEYEVTPKEGTRREAVRKRMVLGYDPRSQSASPPRELGTEIAIEPWPMDSTKGCIAINATKP